MEVSEGIELRVKATGQKCFVLCDLRSNPFCHSWEHWKVRIVKDGSLKILHVHTNELEEAQDD